MGDGPESAQSLANAVRGVLSIMQRRAWRQGKAFEQYGLVRQRQKIHRNQRQSSDGDRENGHACPERALGATQGKFEQTEVMVLEPRDCVRT